MTYFSNALLYLIQLAFGFYILLVLLRLLFQLVRADFYNPVSQFIVTLTQPPLQFLRRFIPGLFGVDLAAVVLLVALQVLEIYLLAWFRGFTPALTGAVVFAAAQLLQFTVYVFLFAIIIRVVLSWINPYGMRHPVAELLYNLTEPMLAPARRLIPPISGLDLSPIAVLVLLQLTLILLVRPLHDLGATLM